MNNKVKPFESSALLYRHWLGFSSQCWSPLYLVARGTSCTKALLSPLLHFNIKWGSKQGPISLKPEKTKEHGFTHSHTHPFTQRIPIDAYSGTSSILGTGGAKMKAQSSHLRNSWCSRWVHKPCTIAWSVLQQKHVQGLQESMVATGAEMTSFLDSDSDCHKIDFWF